MYLKRLAEALVNGVPITFSKQSCALYHSMLSILGRLFLVRYHNLLESLVLIPYQTAVLISQHWYLF